MKNILVTGGAGFIGSHTCLVLLEAGYNLIVFDSLINSSSKSLSRVLELSGINDFGERLSLVKGDIRNFSLLQDVFKNSKEKGMPIDAVIHFAGLKSVSESITEPLKYWDVNVNGTRILLDIMQDHDCYTLVFSSSATIYGSSQQMPISESADIKPINPYGTSKASVEQMLSDAFYSNLYPLKVACLRYFNPVGAHPSGLIGEDPLGIPDNLFPFVSQVAIGRESLLRIFGADWNTPDGTPIRDYIHVMDLAEGHLCALNYLEKNQPQIFKVNLGTGRGYSVFEVINAFEVATDKKIPYEIVDRRKGDVAVNYADISLAKREMNWYAKRTLNSSCIDGWRWQLSNPNGYK